MSFKKRRIGKRSKNWTDDETDRFYEAVTIVGNDVIAIATAFRNEGKYTLFRKYFIFRKTRNFSASRHFSVNRRFLKIDIFRKVD